MAGEAVFSFGVEASCEGTSCCVESGDVCGIIPAEVCGGRGECVHISALVSCGIVALCAEGISGAVTTEELSFVVASAGVVGGIVGCVAGDTFNFAIDEREG